MCGFEQPELAVDDDPLCGVTERLSDRGMEQLDRAAREGPVEAIRINSALVAPHPSYPPTVRSTSVRGHDHSGVARRR
jgi:hypothetical protein